MALSPGYRLVHYASADELFLYHVPSETKYVVPAGPSRDRIVAEDVVETVFSKPLEDGLIAITDACNERCRHCSTGEPKGHRLEVSLLGRLFKDLRELGALRVYLTGGEIFTRPDLFAVLDLAAQNGLSIQLGTNGTLLTEEAVRCLEAYPITLVSLSLDGSAATTHDSFRGLRVAQEKTLAGLAALSASAIPCRVITALHRDVLGELPGLMDILRRYALKGWLLSELFLLGRAAVNERDIVLSFQEVAAAVTRLVALHAQQQVPFPLTGYLVGALSDSGSQGEALCEYPEMVRQLYVCPNGDVLQDTLHWTVVGDVRASPARELWANAGRAWDERPPIPERCSGCLAQPYCVTFREVHAGNATRPPA